MAESWNSLLGSYERFFSSSNDDRSSEIAKHISIQTQQQATEFDDMELMLPQDAVEFEDYFASSSSSSQPLISTGGPESSSPKFPTMKSEDMEIARAISAIFSSDSSASSSVSGLSQVQNNQSSGFKRYSPTIPPTSGPGKRPCGQKMIKDSISYLRKIDSAKDRAGYQKGGRLNGDRLLHVVSEKRRREKLNGSFYELRLLLPPNSKRDKASVLCNAKDYLKTLEAQIFELEQQNQDISGSIRRKNVQIIGSFEPVVGIRRINIKVTVHLECDLLELVLHVLEYLKEARAIGLVSIDADTCLQHRVQFSWATLKFDIRASDWDELSFKKGMSRAVDIATMFS